MRSLFICIAILLININLNANDLNQRPEITWELGYSAVSQTQPEKWIPATVPGAVQLDIAKAENYATYYYAEHYKDLPPGKEIIKIVAQDAMPVTVLNWEFTTMKAGFNQQGPTARFQLPGRKTDRFKVLVEVEGHPE